MWAFNEEAVAQAIFDCPIPIISAVGHETDTTIADFVADLRAPTPSAAAELAVYDIEQLQDKLGEYAYTLQHLCRNRILAYQNKLEQYRMQLKYLSPANQIREKRTYLMKLEETLQDCMEQNIADKRHKLAIFIEQMNGLSPLLKLNQGYSYTADAEGRTISRIEQVKTNDELKVYVKNGMIMTRVIDSHKIAWEEPHE